MGDEPQMAAKPQGKENVAAASSRFGYTGGARAKPRSAAAGAAERKPKSAAVPLQEKKDGDTIVDADPYNLQKTANEAMPDSDEQWREITRKHRLAEKGSNNKTKCAHTQCTIAPVAPRLIRCPGGACGCSQGETKRGNH